MQRGEIWFADVGRGGDRPVLVLTRDPIADRIDAVVVAALTTTVRGLLSELPVGRADGLDRECVVTFDNINTLRRSAFRRHVTTLRNDRMDDACRAMNAALGCGLP
ncbi:MAG: type II toxin-antitoxin system PemK/MazF family toxin [Actinomycetota bacterium]|nr:type II toxin-antitoxin system PemK/MazF family toxin [Actinomycetota bacterium]